MEEIVENEKAEVRAQSKKLPSRKLACLLAMKKEDRYLLCGFKKKKEKEMSRWNPSFGYLMHTPLQ